MLILISVKVRRKHDLVRREDNSVRRDDENPSQWKWQI